MDPAAGPGDIRPRELERPPGERYRTAGPVIRDRPDVGRALLLGAGAGLIVAMAAALLRSVLDVTTGLLALAVGGGWAVGAAVRRGAWAGRPHGASAAPEVMAVCVGAATWVVALIVAWLVAMAILPGSERPLLSRLMSTPFVEWLGPQLGLADLVCLAVTPVFAWLGARSAATATD